MKKLIVLQEEISDCGVCCLLSVIRYFGGNENLESLRIDSLTTSKGVNAYNLIECAKKNGLDAKGLKIDDINSIKLPAIVHFQINKSLTHFVVLYEIVGENFRIMDPSAGLVTLSKEKFLNFYTGFVILFEPKGILPYKKNVNVVKKKIKHSLFKNKIKFMYIIFLELICIILSLISSFYIKIYDLPKYIILLSFIFIFINLCVIFLSYIISKNIKKIYMKISNNLIIDFFQYILNLPLKYLRLKDPGEIVKRSEEINQMNDSIINAIISITINFLLVFMSLFLSGFICPPSIIAALLFIFLEFGLTIIIYKKIFDKSKKVIEINTNYTSSVIDNIYGLTSIKHANCETYINSKLQKLLKEKLNVNYEYQIICDKISSFRSGIATILRLILNIFLINLILLNKFTLQNLIIIDLLLELAFSGINNILDTVVDILYVKNLFTKTNDFYNISTKDDKTLEFSNGDILIKNLDVKLPFILNRKHITTTIKKGEKVIIKGESGCGKSTFCKILYREITNYTGSIKINNRDIQDINLKSYHNNICYSSQSEKIFIGTIKENILLGRKVSDKKFNKIIEVCRIDRITSKRSFGLDTYLIAGGDELSGGERQLIILARALVNNFKILILDETLSEVNDELENDILNNLFTEYDDKTIIYVSHKNKKEYFKRTLNV